MFTRTKFYKHINMSDVFVQVLSIDSVDQNGFYTRVLWWNQGCMGNPWLIRDESDRIYIKNKDLSLWRKLDWAELSKPRTIITVISDEE